MKFTNDGRPQSHPLPHRVGSAVASTRPPWWREAGEWILGALLLRLVGAVLYAGLALALPGCTEVAETTLVSPPLPSELPGSYAVSWRSSTGATSTGTARIAGETVAFTPYPCFLSGGQDELGGAFEYDLDGHLAAEIKTADGALKLTVSGTFDSAATMVGTYAVEPACESGAIEMRRQ